MRLSVETGSKISLIVIFLALIRCIGEFFRLEYGMKESLTIADVKPFILGAFISAIACLLMTILNFFGKGKLIIAIAALTIILLLLIKIVLL